MELVSEIVKSFVAMAPYLVFGFLFAGALHVFVKKDFILKHLGDRSFAAVIKAALIGVPLPLCSCSVIPTAISLKKDKASNPAVLSFLISTPLTGVDSIVATYGVLGPVFAVFRPLVAFGMGIAGGIAALFIPTEKEGEEGVPAQVTPSCCATKEASAKPKTETAACCSTEAKSHAEEPASFFTKTIERIKEIWSYAFKTLLDDIALPLVIGVVVSGVFAWALPDNFFGELAFPIILQMVIVMAVGSLLYVCATASLPIAAVLLMKGMSPGVVFVFLAAGPVTNSATMLLIIKQFGKRFFALYFAVIALLSIAAGLLLDFIIQTFSLTIDMSHMHEHGEHGEGVVMVAVSILFFMLLLMSFKRKLFPQKAETKSSCCG